MKVDPESSGSPGLEIAFSLTVGGCFFLVNLLLAATIGQMGFFDQYLKASILLLGIGCWVTIEKANLGASGAIVLSIICALIVFLNLAFVGYGDM